MENNYKEKIISALRTLKENKASDLFVTSGVPISMKLNGAMVNIDNQVLSSEDVKNLVLSIMNDKQKEEFINELECNFAIAVEGLARFRVNAFVQQGKYGMILRIINTKIPDIESLGVPEVLKKIIMEKRGLVIVVGATG